MDTTLAFLCMTFQQLAHCYAEVARLEDTILQLTQDKIRLTKAVTQGADEETPPADARSEGV